MTFSIVTQKTLMDGARTLQGTAFAMLAVVGSCFLEALEQAAACRLG